MLKGFKEFIMRGNVIDLAVAVVIGAAFTAVVNVVVNSVINPLIGAIFKADSLDDAMKWTIPGTSATLEFGAVIGAVLNFLIIAAVVYFVFVLPVNTIKERAEAKLKRGEPAPEEPDAETELVLLGQIRDLLTEQRSAAPAKHVDPS
ncbi:large conductance mechanosensitive channel protein MscL [Agromyces atrinae]|uniref:Large-conductance mechanosensitive channel n=1 Tax=Agromyces atrinae TaxID=592376 RepID=A0A4Q2M858_9MICO|nr:large conductance mechanosensitive channel protein MscL [Agromyces atrinae]MCI2959440.1 large conductance mechanosensitive channel protein MscL [Agromyces atrinae]NYD68695.1 large conductance mechanosensitive channel [Agromyces atrinae]RXZ86062.1 large conductance mechanosensitive channel protein MscL [Agromyces atrinae]